MLRNLPSDEQASFRRDTAYRETSVFLLVAGVLVIAMHWVDMVAAGGPNWAALAVRLATAAALVVEALVLGRHGRRAVRYGAAVTIATITVAWLALIAVTGGVTSPSLDLVYVFAIAMPVVSFELMSLGILGSIVLVGGTGIILVAGGSTPAQLLTFSYGAFGALVAGWLLARALLRARHAEEQRQRELREALANVRTLRGLLPLCAWCRRIRSDAGYWQQLEAYVTAHSDAIITHGMCPDCAREHFPDTLEPEAPTADAPAPS